MKHYIIGFLAAILLLSPCKGFGKTPSPEQIIEWRRSAAQGDGTAQFNLGVIYYTGQSVKLNYSEAMRWFRLAAQQGNTGAQFNLGVMNENGEGVPQNDAEAMRWFRLAAQQGDAQAQSALNSLGKH